MNKYFKISDAKNFAFYKVPKALFEEKYKSVSTDAKMLYEAKLVFRFGILS